MPSRRARTVSRRAGAVPLGKLSALRRRLLSDSDPPAENRWRSYLAGVEPAVAAVPRVHRFATVPILGDAETVAQPIGVWIEPGSSEAVGRTRASLARGTRMPARLLDDDDLGVALAACTVPRVAIVRAGDELAPPTLERLGQAATLAPDAAVITCDDDLLAPNGSRARPRFRPGPSPERWLAVDDSGPLLVVDRSAASAALAASSALAAAAALAASAALPHAKAAGTAWRHALALALAGPGSERHAHVPLLLCHAGPAAGRDATASRETVARVLAQSDPGARVEVAGAVRRIRRPLRAEPSVEVVVCFRDRPELLERCVASLFARTEYERLALALVDNGSVSPETARLLDRLAPDPRIRILRDGRAFNFAALNNLAAVGSTADALVFLNNDTEIVDPDWVQTLLEEAMRPEVGAVAPMLLYRDGTVQHAGAALGLHGYAGHPFAGLSPEAETPFGYAAEGTRNWLAVTAACTMVERAKFAAVGGFDESFVVAGNDVDLCLRLTAAGHRSLCVPHAPVVHDESRSRGSHIDPGDFVASERSYGAFRTVGDPFYNPNLTLRSTDCGVRVPGEATA